jgi:hypothetical protein
MHQISSELTELPFHLTDATGDFAALVGQRLPATRRAAAPTSAVPRRQHKVADHHPYPAEMVDPEFRRREVRHFGYVIPRHAPLHKFF